MSACLNTFIIFMAGAGTVLAQLPPGHDAWLMKNYRFTGPPAPGSVRPADPVLSELWRIQSQIDWMMRRAKSDQDYEAALAAASQASANAQAIAAVTEQRIAAAAATSAIAEQAKSNEPASLYLIAFRDHTVEKAAKYWIDGLFLHYLTPAGAHVQVRLDLVDQDLSIRLNRELNLEFHLRR
jgi:hypothetical protein